MCYTISSRLFEQEENMFIKRTRSGSKENPKYYLQIVQSYRDKNGKPRHKVIANLGREEEIINDGTIDDLMEKLSKYSKKFILIDKDKESFEKTFIYGPLIVLEKIWKELNMKGILNEIKNTTDIRYDLNNTVKLMVLNRFIEPFSKLRTSEWKDNIFFEDFKDIQLHHLYRSLDVLKDNKDLLQKELYTKQQELFKEKVELVFYDLTTIYIESDKNENSNLKRFGYSKDNKTDCVQVILALILNENKVPIGYEIFPGNTYEGHTVEKTIEDLKTKFDIDKIVFIGDRGILSKDNLKKISQSGNEYIVKAKLSSLPKKIKTDIFNKSTYKMISGVDNEESILMKEYRFTEKEDGKRLVLAYSDKLAKRDKHQRDLLLEKLENRLSSDKKATISSQYKRFLSIKKHKVCIDNNKVKEMEKRDGYFGFYTNNKTLSSLEIFENYKLLWQIEESFRCLKSTLDIRPMFHWTDDRIEGHIAMCFISFYILRVIQKKLSDNSDLNISPDKIFTELSDIKVVKLLTNDEIYYCRTCISGLKNKIIRSLGCKIPSFILKTETI
jgi:transposase